MFLFFGKKMKSKLLLAFFMLSSSMVSASTTLQQTFDTAASFTDNFTQSTPATGSFTWNATSGLSGGPGIAVSASSDQVWTTKESYSVAADGIYSTSAYMYSSSSGYGAIGFSITNQDSNSGQYGAPGGSHFGAFFHGGGGGFLNNGPISVTGTAASSDSPITWSNGGIVGNSWYKLIFTAKAVGGNKFDLTLQIYNADSAGTVGSLVSEHTMTDDSSVTSRVGPAMTNTEVGGATAVRTFFSAQGSRMSKIDNFEIALGGGATYIAAAGPTPVPTLSEWAMIFLANLMGMFAFARIRRQS